MTHGFKFKKSNEQDARRERKQEGRLSKREICAEQGERAAPACSHSLLNSESYYLFRFFKGAIILRYRKSSDEKTELSANLRPTERVAFCSAETCEPHDDGRSFDRLPCSQAQFIYLRFPAHSSECPSNKAAAAGRAAKVSYLARAVLSVPSQNDSGEGRELRSEIPESKAKS